MRDVDSDSMLKSIINLDEGGAIEGYRLGIFSQKK